MFRNVIKKILKNELKLLFFKINYVSIEIKFFATIYTHTHICVCIYKRALNLKLIILLFQMVYMVTKIFFYYYYIKTTV